MKYSKNSIFTVLLVVAILLAGTDLVLISRKVSTHDANFASTITELDRNSFSSAFVATSNFGTLDPLEGVEPLEIRVDRASESANQTWWQALLFDALFRTGIPIFLSILAALAYWIARKIGLKLDLEVLDKIASQAADFAEHRGAHWLKSTGEKSGGALKERWAWELVESVDAKFGASEALRLKLRNLILSKIPDAEAKVAMGKESNGVFTSEETK